MLKLNALLLCYVEYFYSVRKEVHQFTVTYGLLHDPQFTSTHIQFDLEVCILCAHFTF